MISLQAMREVLENNLTDIWYNMAIQIETICSQADSVGIRTESYHCAKIIGKFLFLYEIYGLLYTLLNIDILGCMCNLKLHPVCFLEGGKLISIKNKKKREGTLQIFMTFF